MRSFSSVWIRTRQLISGRREFWLERRAEKRARSRTSDVEFWGRKIRWDAKNKRKDEKTYDRRINISSIWKGRGEQKQLENEKKNTGDKWQVHDLLDPLSPCVAGSFLCLFGFVRCLSRSEHGWKWNVIVGGPSYCMGDKRAIASSSTTKWRWVPKNLMVYSLHIALEVVKWSDELMKWWNGEITKVCDVNTIHVRVDVGRNDPGRSFNDWSTK